MAVCPLGSKYGVMPAEARPLLALAKALGLSVVGVAFHVGSGCKEPQVFLRAIKQAKRVCGRLFCSNSGPEFMMIHYVSLCYQAS